MTRKSAITCEYCGSEIMPDFNRGKKRIKVCPNCKKFIIINRDKDGEYSTTPYSDFFSTVFARIGLIYGIFGLIIAVISLTGVFLGIRNGIDLFLSLILSSMCILFSIFARHGNAVRILIGLLFGVSGAVLSVTSFIMMRIL